MTEKPRRLGRGLSALIASAETTQPPTVNKEVAAAGPAASQSESPLRDIPLTEIRPNPFQPRRSFKPAELSELESSLRVSGLLQPITVRAHATGGYELIAGERRLRAATRLGWATIPAVVKSHGDQDMLLLALVENLQRSDLNPLDEALGLQRLIDEFHLTQQQVADSVGKDRSTVANLLRVLGLPDGVKALLRDEKISLGHARALLAFPNERSMLEAAKQIVDNQLTVRETERLSQQEKPAPTAQPASSTKRQPARAEDAQVRRLTEVLRRRLQTDVRIQFHGDSRGEVSITFYSSDDLHRVIELISGQRLDDV